MIGEDFQADLPVFLPRNEGKSFTNLVLTVWMD